MAIVDIREATASIASAIRNALIDFTGMTVSVVAVVTDVMREGRPVVGYGFHSNGRYAQGGILRDRFLPRLRAAEPHSLLDATGNIDPFAVWRCFMANEKPGGHGDRAVAAGALDMAMWDATAKIAEQPLWRLLSNRYNDGRYDQAVMVYPGGGYYYPGKEIEGLKDELRRYREQGYRVVKMKIGGVDLGTDLTRIDAALAVVGDGSRLAVDANGRYDLPGALACADAIERLRLFWFEEPCDPLDFRAHALLAKRYCGPIATGENLFSVQDAENLILYAGLRRDQDWLQFDPALAYGLTHYLRLIRMAAEHGWDRRRLMPHGGHQLALNIAAGLQIGGTESYPLVFQPFGGFADDIPVENGFTRPHDTPGIGIERKRALHALLRSLLGV